VSIGKGRPTDTRGLVVREKEKGIDEAPKVVWEREKRSVVKGVFAKTSGYPS